MIRKLCLENNHLSKDLEPNNWLPVDVSSFSAAKKAKFNRRKRAVDLYLSSDLSIEKILYKCGLSKSELIRILKRAFDVSPDGDPWGYTACIPNFRFKKYERTTNKLTGHAGLFSQFLRQYPNLEDSLKGWALGKKKIDECYVRGRNTKIIWEAFKDNCTAKGIDTELDYPFSNRDGGREVIRNYCRKVQKENFIEGAIAEFGDNIQSITTNHICLNNAVPILKPYNKVQFDAHRLDAELIIRIKDQFGEEQELPLSRIWLLVLIDVSSRAILGYSLSLSENYTMEDLLECIASSFTPWLPKENTNGVIHYKRNAGLPSGVIDKCAWRSFDVVQLDNAYANISSWLQNRIISTGAIEIISNKARRPRSNSIIERFMRTFEEASLHRWPNTTGSNPQDPRRRNATQQAKKLLIEYENLELVTDVAIANYNASPHTSLNGRTPLEYIRYRIDRAGDIPRYLTNQQPDNIPLFERNYFVTIRSSREHQHRPYIKFKGVRYSSDFLRINTQYTNQRATFRVNIKDIRTGLLFLENGKCIGRLEAEERWMIYPHSLKIRCAILKLIKQKRLYSDTLTPLSDYMNFLNKRANKYRKDRNRLLHLQHSSTEFNKLKQEKQNIPTKHENWVSLNKVHTTR